MLVRLQDLFWYGLNMVFSFKLCGPDINWEVSALDKVASDEELLPDYIRRFSIYVY